MRSIGEQGREMIRHNDRLRRHAALQLRSSLPPAHAAPVQAAIAAGSDWGIWMKSNCHHFFLPLAAVATTAANRSLEYVISLSRKLNSIPLDCRPVLIIPTLSSRTTLSATLDSVLPCENLFARVFISINGLPSASHESALDAFSKAIEGRCILLRTGKFIKAQNHARFIARNTAKLLHPRQSTMFLCDDDLLGSKESLIEYFRFVQQDNNFIVGMGNFATFQHNPESFHIPTQNLAANEAIQSTDFVARTRAKSHFSNISSMMMAAKIWQDAVLFMSIFGSSGYFAEYIYATHRSASLLYSPPSISAYIREHPNQEARTLPYVAFVHDEIIYFLWVWLNQPLTRPFTPGHLKYGLSAHRFKGIIIERLYLFIKSNFPGLLKLYFSLKKFILGKYKKPVNLD